ncbi:elongin-A-like [Gastrophryne carolinensis]
MDAHGLMQRVQQLQDRLGHTQDPRKISKTLKSLQELDISLEILVETGVGKTVNGFRKHTEVGDIAKSIVYQWKKLVPEATDNFGLRNQNLEAWLMNLKNFLENDTVKQTRLDMLPSMFRAVSFLDDASAEAVKANGKAAALISSKSYRLVVTRRPPEKFLLTKLPQNPEKKSVSTCHRSCSTPQQMILVPFFLSWHKVRSPVLEQKSNKLENKEILENKQLRSKLKYEQNKTLEEKLSLKDREQRNADKLESQSDTLKSSKNENLKTLEKSKPKEKQSKGHKLDKAHSHSHSKAEKSKSGVQPAEKAEKHVHSYSEKKKLSPKSEERASEPSRHKKDEVRHSSIKQTLEQSAEGTLTAEEFDAPTMSFESYLNYDQVSTKRKRKLNPTNEPPKKIQVCKQYCNMVSVRAEVTAEVKKRNFEDLINIPLPKDLPDDYFYPSPPHSSNFKDDAKDYASRRKDPQDHSNNPGIPQDSTGFSTRNHGLARSHDCNYSSPTGSTPHENPAEISIVSLEQVLVISAVLKRKGHEDLPEPLIEIMAESSGFTGKRQNSKMLVYSGSKTIYLPKMLTLYEQCIRVLQNNIDSIQEVGGVPFEILEPVLKRCTPEQLNHIEECNPVFMEDSFYLWKKHCERDFKGHQLLEYESWREMYLRLFSEREEKLKMITQNISSTHSGKPKGRQVKLAYIHEAAKPPRNIRRKQEINGTAGPIIQPHPLEKLKARAKAEAARVQLEFAEKEATIIKEKSEQEARLHILQRQCAATVAASEAAAYADMERSEMESVYGGPDVPEKPVPSAQRTREYVRELSSAGAIKQFPNPESPEFKPKPAELLSVQKQTHEAGSTRVIKDEPSLQQFKHQSMQDITKYRVRK